MCFSSPKIPDIPPPPQVPPPDEQQGEVKIGPDAQAAKGKRRKVRGRELLTVGLNVPTPTSGSSVYG